MLFSLQGFYDTMDAGEIDEQGYVKVRARADDVINVSGHRLSTSALEEVLLEHEDVVDCAVVGIHDELKGQVPLGVYVKRKGSFDGAKASLLRDNQERYIECLRSCWTYFNETTSWIFK